MKLSVIIPVYNEPDTIRRIVNRVMKVDMEKEIIIIDQSTDDTYRIVGEIMSYAPVNQSDIKLFRMTKKKSDGKGSAIREGLKYVTGDIVIIQDADLEYDPNDYYELVRPIVEGRASVVYGSRILGNNEKSSLCFYLGGRLLTFLANILYKANITDEPTCYKVFLTAVIKSIDLKCKRFDFCPEVTAKVRKMGYEILEVPIHYYPRSLEEGKKIRWQDGIEAIWTLIKYR